MIRDIIGSKQLFNGKLIFKEITWILKQFKCQEKCILDLMSLMT